MKKLSIAIWAESKKIRKSKTFIITFIIFASIPLMLGLMMYLFQHPEIAEKLGIIGAKAQMFGGNDWNGFLSLVNQSHATIGLIGYGFVTAWIFGNEHTGHTMKDILVLPVSRNTILLSKFVASFIWCMLLSLVLLTGSLLIGKLIQIDGWSTKIIIEFVIRFVVSAALILFLSTPVAYIAGISRGYFAAIGFVILTMIIVQFFSVLGLGPVFPWAIPGLFAVNSDAPGMALSYYSYIILITNFFVFYVLTLRWWNKADHH